MAIRFSSSSGRFYNDSNGQFVSQSKAMRSSIARDEYSDYLKNPTETADFTPLSSDELPSFYNPQDFPEWSKEAMRFVEMDRQLLVDPDARFDDYLFEDWGDTLDYWEDYFDDEQDYASEGDE